MPDRGGRAFARRLRAEGQLEQALASVEQALRHDSDDAAASALRQELLEVLTRT